MRPYVDSVEKNLILREFDSKLSSDELVWHRDSKDRRVTVVKGTGWKIQYENSLPVPMVEGVSYWIEKDEWHRLIKGNSSLKLEIEEL